MHLTLHRRIINHAELVIILILSYILGINFVIKYLRNPNPALSIKIIRYYGGEIGKNTTLKRSIQFDNVMTNEGGSGNFNNLKIGNNVYVGDCVYFDLADKIIIEDDITISSHCKFITHQNCENSVKLSRKFKIKKKRVLIKSGTWLTTGVGIFYSIINENSLVSAGINIIDNEIPSNVIIRKNKKSQFEIITYEKSNKVSKR